MGIQNKIVETSRNYKEDGDPKINCKHWKKNWSTADKFSSIQKKDAESLSNSYSKKKNCRNDPESTKKMVI